MTAYLKETKAIILIPVRGCEPVAGVASIRGFLFQLGNCYHSATKMSLQSRKNIFVAILLNFS